MQRVSVAVPALVGLGIVSLLIGVSFLLGLFEFVRPVFGVVFLAAGLVLCASVFTGTGTASKTGAAADYQLLVCPNCHKEALIVAADKHSWCADCERRKRARLRIAGLTFLLVIALPLTLQLTRKNQDIRERAAEPKINVPRCDPGIWQPDSCACGIWESSNQFCNEDEYSRNCAQTHYCCKTPQSGIWECRLLE